MQQSQFVTNSIQEDEIDLRELFKILVRYKIFIAVFTILVTLGAIVYALSKTPIYEVKSNVQVGYIEENLIVEPETLVKTLNLVFNVEDKLSSDNEFVSEVTTISANKNLKNFIEIKTEAISNEEALKKNREVVDFIKNSYQPKIEQYLTEAKNSIENTKRAIKNIDDFEIKNIKEQIIILKKHGIVKIEEEIKRLKEQDIKKLQQQIHLLKSQKIVKIDEEIGFSKDFKLKTIEAKIDFHTKKLEEYTQSVNKLYSDIRNAQEATASTIASIQMVNYQNLILNSQNKIEDLKVEKEVILAQTIPNLEREKENITNVSIRDLELQIENIKNIKIAELQREKENISNESIRKLQHQINVELVSKKIKLNEQIDRLNYSITKQNIRNNEVVGDFIVKDYPVKPKRKLIVVVAFVSGLVLSIFMVFLLNFFRDEKAKELSA
ncbi:Wzz/FepE/Etk N-terminal domain-containing protein [Sulfurimonas sp.]|uniref:Wzz/FepE/Etk N-terminal domain-containing protein n=1 Tax=Sulfurimonas sp. TaxID=2022749 RepID=UPI0019E6B296|nr:Wzz/FepE/Etk N-terminal domain-containing protein [Sulfurimonas sp.]MBE0515658.1 hypothetical protein [Sulfurimonas sp.]